jgi:hypothetical protein
MQRAIEEAKGAEGAVERQAWGSAPRLQVLIKGHEQRIEKLSGNSQAGEILAYDHESIVRLQKRIADLAAEEAAKAAEQVEQTSAVN